MLAPRPSQTIDGETLETIQIAVDGYLRRHQISGMDCEELVQEVSLSLIRHGHRFDPGIASFNTFINCIVRRTVATVRRRRVRERLEYSETTLSIHTSVQLASGEGEEISSQLSADNGSSPRQKFFQRRTEVQLSELKHDIQVLIEQLPSDQSEVLEALLEHPSVSAASQALGISRMQMQRRVYELRDLLGPLGLHQDA